MRTVVHLCDLHFGQIDEAMLTPLITFIHEIRPNLVAISGDLTRRAPSSQFEQARAFLETIEAPRTGLSSASPTAAQSRRLRLPLRPPQGGGWQRTRDLALLGPLQRDCLVAGISLRFTT